LFVDDDVEARGGEIVGKNEDRISSRRTEGICDGETSSVTG
jgi:hypothetical protein